MTTWTKDPRVEQQLKKLRIKYEIAEIPIDQIDVKRSLQTQGRHDTRLDEDLVVKYAMAIEAGDSLPAIVLLRSKSAKHLVLSGNHRVAGAQLAGATVSAYVIELADEFLRDYLPVLFNVIEGRSQPLTEVTAYGVRAVTKYGIKPVAAAQMLNIKPRVLGEAIRAQAVYDRLTHLGVRVHEGTHQNALLALHRLVDNDNVLAAVARLCVSKKRAGTDTIQVVKEVRSKRTESERLAHVKQVEQQEASVPPLVRTHRNVRTAFLMALGSLETATKGAGSLRKLQITNDDERKQVLSRLTRLINRFRQLGARNGQAKRPSRRAM